MPIFLAYSIQQAWQIISCQSYACNLREVLENVTRQNNLGFSSATFQDISTLCLDTLLTVHDAFNQAPPHTLVLQTTKAKKKGIRI